MVRSLPLVSLVCAAIYLLLPMRPLPNSELERVYAVWKQEAAEEDVLLLRQFAVSTKAAAERFHARATASNFTALQREAGILNEGNIGEWTDHQLTDFFGENYGAILAGVAVGGISSVIPTEGGGGAFYLVVEEKKRTIPAFLSIKSDIEKRYNAYRISVRWTSWLSSDSIPSDEDFDDWYTDAHSSWH